MWSDIVKGYYEINKCLLLKGINKKRELFKFRGRYWSDFGLFIFRRGLKF